MSRKKDVDKLIFGCFYNLSFFDCRMLAFCLLKSINKENRFVTTAGSLARQMAIDLGEPVSRKKVQRSLEKLEKFQVLSLVSTKRSTIVTPVYYAASAKRGKTAVPSSVPSSVPKISDDILKICKWFKESLPSNIRSKIDLPTSNAWIKTIDRCHQLDGFSFDEIFAIVKWARQDDFWKSQFNSLNKLRLKGKNQEYTFILRWQMLMEESSTLKTGRELSNSHISHESDF